MIKVYNNKIILTNKAEIDEINIKNKDLTEIKIITFNSKFKLNKINLNKIKYVYIIIDINNLKTKKNIKHFIRFFIKLNKRIKKLNIQLGINNNEDIIIAEFLHTNEIDKKTYDDIIFSIEAILYDNIKSRYEYIYNKICEYLDNDFIKNNYCDFKDDVCIAKRTQTNENKVTMGCCHRFKHGLIFGKLNVCKYLENKRCSAQCITCKLFTCNCIKVKYNINDMILIYGFFNTIQKFIIKTSFFTKKEIIIKRLLIARTQ